MSKAGQMLPIDDSYFSNSQFDYFFSLPVCNAQVEADKIKLRRMLYYYNNDTYNTRIYYRSTGYCTLKQGYLEYLNTKTVKSTDEECIDGSQPNKGQWHPPLSQEEANVWQQQVAQYASDNRLCS